MIKVEFTEHQLQALIGLLDAATRTVGLKGVKDIMGIMLALETAEPVVKVAPVDAACAPMVPVYPEITNPDPAKNNIPCGNGEYRPDPDCPHPGVPV